MVSKPLHGPRHGRTAGAAPEDALFRREAAGHLEALLVVDPHHVVHELEVDRGRDEVFADAFEHVAERVGQLTGAEVVVVDGTDRIDADDLHVGVLLFQILSNA